MKGKALSHENLIQARIWRVTLIFLILLRSYKFPFNIYQNR